MLKKRYLFDSIKSDLLKKMVFVGGPRQVGKTTLVLNFIKPASTKNPAYLSWDIVAHKKNIFANEFPLSKPLIIFDEIHKYAKWRDLLKGLFDENSKNNQFLVTGSARLDYFSKGGDSLFGRYHYYRLHPFCINELTNKPNQSDIEHILNFGGFPEPLFSGLEKDLKRWQNQRNHVLVYDDLRNLENVKELSLIELLLDSLPIKVGSPLSLKSLQEDLSVSYQSVERWISILERLYLVYRIPPFGSPKIRAVKKEQKLYFWDWSIIKNKGFKFENMIASYLLKYCHFLQDSEGDKMELRYLRDTDLREIDFVVLKNNKPIFAVECKTGDKAISKHIKYFKQRTNIPIFYQVHMGTKDFGNEETLARVLPFLKFCKIIKSTSN